MTTVQLNLSRSGGYFVWTIVRALQRAAGTPPRSFIEGHRFRAQRDAWPDQPFDVFALDHLTISPMGLFCDVDVLMREFVLDIDAYIDASTLVTSDSPIGPRHAEVLPRFSSRFYLVRDPRDRLVSWSTFAFKPYFKRYGWSPARSPVEFLEQHLEDLMTDWRDHVVGALAVRETYDLHVVRYEDILSDFESTVGGLARHLGLDVGPADLREVARSVSFEKMAQVAPEHLQHGKSGRWADVLTPAQVAACETIAGEAMRRLGYGIGS